MIHQDDQVTVVDKPAGLLSVPGKLEWRRDCLERGTCSPSHIGDRCSLRWSDAARRTRYSSGRGAEGLDRSRTGEAQPRPNATPFLMPAS